jgi:hypothetical protein
MMMGKRRKFNEDFRAVWVPLSGKLWTKAFWILGYSGFRVPPPKKQRQQVYSQQLNTFINICFTKKLLEIE